MVFIFYQKKRGREKIVFGEFNQKESSLNYEGKIYKIISEKEYRDRVDSHLFNPFIEGEIPIFDFVIRLNKNINNDKLSIFGLGPYTLGYRKELLMNIIELKKKMKDYKIEIISDEEIIKIMEIFRIVVDALRNDNYLDYKVEGLINEIEEVQINV